MCVNRTSIFIYVDITCFSRSSDNSWAEDRDYDMRNDANHSHFFVVQEVLNISLGANMILLNLSTHIVSVQHRIEFYAPPANCDMEWIRRQFLRSDRFFAINLSCVCCMSTFSSRRSSGSGSDSIVIATLPPDITAFNPFRLYCFIFWLIRMAEVCYLALASNFNQEQISVFLNFRCNRYGMCWNW